MREPKRYSIRKLEVERLKWNTPLIYFLNNTLSAGGDEMECPRCHGLMVIDACLNRGNVHHTVWIHEWRCLNCGEFSDAQISANRVPRQQTVSTRLPQKVA